MATDSQLQDFLSRAGQNCDQLLQAYEPLLEDDTLYNGTPLYSGAIDQTWLDNHPEYGGMTVQEVADALYVESTIKGNIAAGLAALIVFKNRTR